jgi:hypothetical protein
MKRNEVKLADGRYLLFYSFDAAPPPKPSEPATPPPSGEAP